MYSPKIDESLIPIIYTKAKEAKIPMTKYVNLILRDKLIDTTEITETVEPDEIKSEVAWINIT